MVLVETLVFGLEIDLVWLLISIIHERYFKSSTTYPFCCKIFQLCRDTRVPVFHKYVLRAHTGTVDIGLIRDKANVAARQ